MLVPGIRQEVGRRFVGPLRPGIAGSVGARGGVVADDTRGSDLGMDRMKLCYDSIGKKYPESDAPERLIAERRNRRGD
ncbi:MAG: hypothetical protein J2P48_10960 [Alphaproteobacteria bacterium]|nr:hypothetical protein [Alphaproteobacteria bacterium]